MRRVAQSGAVVGAAVLDARGGFVANRIIYDTAAILDPKTNERRVVAAVSAAEQVRLRDAVRLAYVDGEADGPRSYAAVAWAVKGLAP